jgi:hypothetical protein
VISPIPFHAKPDICSEIIGILFCESFFFPVNCISLFCRKHIIYRCGTKPASIDYFNICADCSSAAIQNIFFTSCEVGNVVAIETCIPFNAIGSPVFRLIKRLVEDEI